jgi:cellulose synthase/poly-beta-1,6-N-acetylglucosamine synthase-like glycosyltransferase
MKNLLICILTDRYPEKLERCIKSIDCQNTDSGKIVVCNTLNLDYIPIAKAIAEKYDWPFLVTESHGTCAKGKNTVLEHFATTEYEYLTIIDGDDYFEPSSISILKRIADKHHPDVLGLRGSSAILGEQRIPLQQWENSEDWIRRTKEKIPETRGVRKLISLYERAKRILEWNRFVLISKRCLPFFKFNENTIIDDLHLSIKLKHYVNQGALKYIVVNSDNIYTYDATDFGGFGTYLKSDPDTNVKVFWEDLTGLDLTGEIPVIEENDG